LREVSGVLAAVLARKPDIGRIEARLGAPRADGYVLARESPRWIATHGGGVAGRKLAAITSAASVPE
jgi:hypothetical protein